MQSWIRVRKTRTRRAMERYARARAEAAEPRRRPRPPVMARRVKVNVAMGAWRRGSLAWRVAKGFVGRRARSSMGAMDRKAKIWWGLLKALDCGVC
jgi:hypothetical protein